MTFFKVIQRVPRPYSETLGGESAERFGDHPKEIRGFIKGVAGTSPYLKSLIDREHLWLNEVLSISDDLLEQTIKAITIDKNIPLTLRQAKRRIALWVALCDLAGAWSLEEVTGALSDFADHAVSAALNVAVQRQAERKKIPGFRADDNPETAGVFVLAMGKMGAKELNYSSDIDLICLFDDSRFDPADFHDARSAFIKATREMSTTLNDLTAEGYVFRTDLRLRPDPSVTPVCIGTDAAERYYESLGRTWERAAYIKARVCGGDLSAGSAFLKRMQPFVWRKHLDFTAIEDAHNMRLAIRDHKG
ncbi:MAG: glutamine-synthetase adenylyltransferase, partial [Paracoccaceae bacterium]